MHQIKQSEGTAARRRVLLYLVSDADGISPSTGVTASAGDIKISKNGAAEANHAGTLTEIALGRYYYEFTAGEVDTFGFISLSFSKTNVRAFIKECQVVANDPYTAISISVAGIWDYLTSAIVTAGSIGKLIKDDLDATISSRLPTSSYVAPSTPPTAVAIRTEIDANSTQLAAIKTKTDSLTFTTPNVVDASAIVTDKTGFSLSTAGVDAILDDAPATELSAVPSVTASMRQMIQFIYTYLRNRRVVTQTTETLYKDDSTTPMAVASVADDGTQTSKSKMA